MAPTSTANRKGKAVFKPAIHAGGKRKIQTPGVYTWDGGHTVTSQDFRLSEDRRRIYTTKETAEFNKPAATLPDHPYVSPLDDCPNEFSDVVVRVEKVKRPRQRYIVSVSQSSLGASFPNSFFRTSR